MRFGKINTIWDIFERYYNRSDIALLDDIDDVSKALDILAKHKEVLIHEPDFTEGKLIETLELYEDFLIQKNYLTSMKLVELSNIALKLNGDLTKLRGDYSNHLGLMEKNISDSEELHAELKTLLQANERLNTQLLTLTKIQPEKCFLHKIKKLFSRF